MDVIDIYISVMMFLNMLIDIGEYKLWDTRMFNFTNDPNIAAEGTLKITDPLLQFNFTHYQNIRVNKNETSGDYTICVNGIIAPDWFFSCHYEADMVINDEIPLYGTGQYKGRLSDVSISLCYTVPQNFEQILHINIDFQFRHGPVYQSWESYFTMEHMHRSQIINIDSSIIYPPDIENPTCWQGFKLAVTRSTLVSEHHPIVLEYFNSEVALLNEKKRQSKLYQWTIHPLSMFKQYYDIWCFFFYGPLIVLKLMEWSFIHVQPLEIDGILWIIFVLDVLSWIDIILQFFIGYSVAKTKNIELSKRMIAKRYIYSGLFFCDVLSAIPKMFFVYPLLPAKWYLFFNTCILLKLRRTVTFFYSIQSIAYYLNISAQKVFLLSFFFFTMFIMHAMTCLHVGIPLFRRVLTGKHHPDSWIKPSFHELSLRQAYVRTFFRTSQYTMLIYLNEIKISYKLTEEITVGSVNYVVGKLMIVITWIILLRNFVSQNSVKIKFREVMVELEEYIKAKQIPPELRQRLLTYYMYKYQRMFFNEKFIKNMFSTNLKKEINVFLCKTLISSVTIFSKLSPKEVEQVIMYLVPEIFLPNEIITQSGNPADSMYFLENGTVAVFTPSGKEVGHLQDGAHFGEVAILIKEKHRTATVVAIEISRVYKLSKSNFDKCFRNKPEIFDALLKLAEERIKELKEVEENYKKVLFEMMYKSQN